MSRILAASGLILCAAVVVAAQTVDLPEGEGKRILVASCTSCHELTEVTKFRGFYTEAQWRDVVKTMVEYGAEMKKGDDEVLVRYLTEHLGKK